MLQNTTIKSDDLMKFTQKSGSNEPKNKFTSGLNQVTSPNNQQRNNVARRAIATAAGSAGKSPLVLASDSQMQDANANIFGTR